MTLKRALAAVVAASLVGTPVVAQAAAVQGTRTSAEVEGENLRGGWLVPALAIIAIILGILAIANGGDDLPTSP